MTFSLNSGSAICPLCGAEKVRRLYNFEPARYIPGDVVRCLSCGMIFKVPSASARDISEYYDKAYADLDYWENSGAAEDAFDVILKDIERKSSGECRVLLDVGCGPGEFLALARKRGFLVSGVEMNPELAERARNLVGAEISTDDIMKHDFGLKRFDVITLLDLIEHVKEPLLLLRRCHSLLKEGGLLVVYTPNHGGFIVRTARFLFRVSAGLIRDPVNEIFDCLHLAFFDARTIVAALVRAGFGDVELAYMKYDCRRSNQARGFAAMVLGVIELFSPLLFGPFRMLATARKGGS